KGDEADEAVHSERSSRVRGGYDRVVEWLRAGLPSAPGTLRLNTAVAEIRWEPGHVRLAVRAAGGADDGRGDGARETIAARCAIVTVPLGVLQQPPDAPGAIRFAPALPDKDAALGALHMGAVVKVVLRFREPFWAAAVGGHEGRGGRAPLGFLRTPEEPIPTWWTQAPGPAPVLAGWTGGPNAERLSALSDDELRDVALETLGHVFGGLGGRRRVESLLVSWHYHDWQRDPFARGAYSYVGVNGVPAQEALARPVESTLYFAGEATEYHGHFSTVHGAIASGQRAAQEVLVRLGRA
ncbi:MAG: FAD-dependent oxidoreductase, partial [Acetobacteraceae bacterium]|nr:FAD-dependent oxidoreductase [Acetobacteraceae bacterium]